MNTKDEDLRPDYSPEFVRSGVRGKYAKQYKEGTNVVLLDPDVAKEFPDSAAVNDALRQVLRQRSKKKSPDPAI